MIKKKYLIGIFTIFLFGLMACQSTVVEESSMATEEQEPEIEVNTEPVEVELTDYSETIGFEMEAPPTEVLTTFTVKGSIKDDIALQEDYIWVIIRKTESIEEIDSREIEYYLPIDNGQFQADLTLPNGEGEYRVTVRAPAEDRDNYFYDTAIFRISNMDETIEREVEYTKYGTEKKLNLADSVQGWNQATDVFTLEGQVNDDYIAASILAAVKKDGEESMIALPVEDGRFSGDVPLSFGKGTHEINIRLYTDDEDDKKGSYYDSASLYVYNDSDKSLPEIKQYGPYIDRGVSLESPSFATESELSAIEYPVKGTINPDASLSDTVSHVIVEVQLDGNHRDKATYFFPVENNQFDGTAHFRFGPGDYTVTIHVPEEEQKDKSKLYYTAALAIKHQVNGIEDKRDLLPSRGVDSDNPLIIEEAERITDGLTTERDKAKAIYQFVAEHVSYDVKKFKDDIFHPDDTASATLESGKGICQDYTFLALALLRSNDIEARYVQGYAGGRHAWVEAKLDGEWVEMDPTWGAGYVDGDEFHFQYNEDYFDPDPDFLKETHTRLDLLY